MTAAKIGLDAIENASRDEITALQVERLRWTLKHAYDNVPHYRAKFDAQGVHPDDFHSLDDLPDAIPAPWREGNETEPLLIEMATIDDIAFAVVAANADVSAAIRRSSALERLHRLAREAGALGTDRAVDAALKQEGR